MTRRINHVIAQLVKTWPKVQRTEYLLEHISSVNAQPFLGRC